MKGNNLKNIGRALTGNNSNWLLFAPILLGVLGQISQKEIDGFVWIALCAGWERASRGWTISWQDLRQYWQILRMAPFGKPAFTFSMHITIKLLFDITEKKEIFF